MDLSGFGLWTLDFGLVPANLAELTKTFVNPRQRGARALKPFEREVERLAIMRVSSRYLDSRPVKPLASKSAA